MSLDGFGNGRSEPLGRAPDMSGKVRTTWISDDIGTCPEIKVWNSVSGKYKTGLHLVPRMCHTHTTYVWANYFDSTCGKSVTSLARGDVPVQGLPLLLLHVYGQPYQKRPQVCQYRWSKCEASVANGPINVGPCSRRLTLCLGTQRRDSRPLPLANLRHHWPMRNTKALLPKRSVSACEIVTLVISMHIYKYVYIYMYSSRESKLFTSLWVPGTHRPWFIRVPEH